MKKILFVIMFFVLFLSFPKTGYTQQDSLVPKITLKLSDSPVRTSFEMLFKQALIKNYVIDNEVSGFITMEISEQPFDVALKLIMRGASKPLTYIKENDVYIIKLRQISQSNPSRVPDITQIEEKNNITWEKIPLVYIDPYDLMGAFGRILGINQFSRFSGMGMMGGMGNGGFGGGFGSTGGLGGGSMGGFGGGGMGMGNGFGGGGMGGFGGMMGGMGGFGGGRNF